MSKINLIENFVSDAEVLELTSYYESSSCFAEANRCCECNKPYYKFLDFKHKIFSKAADKMCEIYGQDLQLALSGMSIMTNYIMQYHADNERPTKGNIVLGKPDESENLGLADLEKIIWEPNHCSTRLFTGVIYLNTFTDYGATVFPQQKLKYQPIQGNLLVFPCDKDYIHGIQNTGKNIRLAGLVWLERKI